VSGWRKLGRALYHGLTNIPRYGEGERRKEKRRRVKRESKRESKRDEGRRGPFDLFH
jgi:hypothetical protein